MSNIFSSLKGLGLNYEETTEIYKVKEENQEKKGSDKQDKSTDMTLLLYDKKETCPVCAQGFMSKAVKSNAPRVKSKDTDLFIRYNVINPYFYEVIVCPHCGYSALKSDFNNVRSYQKEKISGKVSTQWKGREYPELFDENIAIERYKLALLNAVIGELNNSTKAVICLKTAWMYRLLGKEQEEKEFLAKSLQGFLIAYENERTPIYGLDRFSLEYLIGEIYRRTGDFVNAKLWLGKVIISKADPKLKDKARDIRDLIIEEEKNSLTYEEN